RISSNGDTVSSSVSTLDSDGARGPRGSDPAAWTFTMGRVDLVGYEEGPVSARSVVPRAGLRRVLRSFARRNEVHLLRFQVWAEARCRHAGHVDSDQQAAVPHGAGLVAKLWCLWWWTVFG